MRWKVRIAGAADVDVACALLRPQFDEHDIALSSARLREATLGLLAGPPRGRVIFAEEGAAVVGIACLAYTWTLENGGLTAWLDELYVAPEARGRGAGRALLAAAIDRAREDGCRAVDLEVDVDHARAEHLYERAGFTHLPRRRWQRMLVPR